MAGDPDAEMQRLERGEVRPALRHLRHAPRRASGSRRSAVNQPLTRPPRGVEADSRSPDAARESGLAYRHFIQNTIGTPSWATTWTLSPARR